MARPELEQGVHRVEASLVEAKACVEGQLARSPYLTLAAVAGVGYVLGGGLFTRFTGRVLLAAVGFGLRAAVLPLVEQELAGAAQEALGLDAPKV